MTGLPWPRLVTIHVLYAPGHVAGSGTGGLPGCAPMERRLAGVQGGGEVPPSTRRLLIDPIWLGAGGKLNGNQLF